MPTIVIISTTIGSAESAQSIAKQLVDTRVAACVQIDGPIESVYRWQDQLCVDSEYRLSCKTTQDCLASTTELLRKLHSYEVPELIVSEVETSTDYYNWLRAQVTS